MPNTLEDIELRSEQVQDILSYVPHWMIRYGNVLFFSLIALVLLLSWFVKYPDIITSEALLTTEISPQKEYAKSTGKLSAILIKDNEVVSSNTPLAIIENTANYEDVFKLKAIIDTLKVNRKSFSFPIDEMPILFLGNIDASYALFENSYIQYKLNSQLKPFSNEAIANKTSISELTRRLQTSKQQLAISESELLLKERDLNRYKTLLNSGNIARLEYEQKELEYKQAQRNFITFKSSISQVREALSNANKVSKGNEINQVKEELILLKNVIQSFNQLKSSIKDWEQRYLLKTNIDGKVSFSNYWKNNETVNQGDLVFTIIPIENSNFIAKLKTPPANSGKLKIGQVVNIKLENYPDAEFGILKGAIESISLVQDKEGFYRIKVKLPNKLTTSYNKDIVFKQEMAGSAEIITEDLRLIERFFYQLKDVFKR